MRSRRTKKERKKQAETETSVIASHGLGYCAVLFIWVLILFH